MFKDYLMVIIVGLGRSKPRKMKARVIAVVKIIKECKERENCNHTKSMEYLSSCSEMTRYHSHVVER